MTSQSLILVALFLGLSAGVSPGPLLTLVITQTIRHNGREGIKTALSPLVTDLPVIALTVFILSKLTQFNTILGIISIAGGLYVAYLGIETLISKGIDVDTDLEVKPGSLGKGIVANILSPHPYLFWATIGGPYAVQAFDISILTGILFFVAFYVMLIGSKMLIAIFIGKTKGILGEKIFIWIIRIMGIALIIFSVLFFRQALLHLS